LNAVQEHGSILAAAKAITERFQHLDDLIRTTSDMLFQGVFVEARVNRRLQDDGKKDQPIHQN